MRLYNTIEDFMTALAGTYPSYGPEDRVLTPGVRLDGVDVTNQNGALTLEANVTYRSVWNDTQGDQYSCPVTRQDAEQLVADLEAGQYPAVKKEAKDSLAGSARYALRR